MIIIEKISAELAESLCRKITADLPEYFGLPEANEHYALGVKAYANFAAQKNGNYVGLIGLLPLIFLCWLQLEGHEFHLQGSVFIE